jgi:hypothetical protein
MEVAEPGGEEKPEELRQVYEYLRAVEMVRSSRDEHQVARLVEEHRLLREHVPTWMMRSKEVRLPERESILRPASLSWQAFSAGHFRPL